MASNLKLDLVMTASKRGPNVQLMGNQAVHIRYSTRGQNGLISVSDIVGGSSLPKPHYVNILPMTSRKGTRVEGGRGKWFSLRWL